MPKVQMGLAKFVNNNIGFTLEASLFWGLLLKVISCMTCLNTVTAEIILGELICFSNFSYLLEKCVYLKVRNCILK